MQPELDSLPILNKVIETGDQFIIQSSRRGFESANSVPDSSQRSSMGITLKRHILALSSKVANSAPANQSLSELPVFNIMSGLTQRPSKTPSHSTHSWQHEDNIIAANTKQETKAPRQHTTLKTQNRAVDHDLSNSSAPQSAIDAEEEQIEHMIEQIVERHVSAMREDIKTLLAKVAQKS